jgi:hypothetical protein
MYSAKREGERSGRAAFTLNGTIVRERSIMWTTTTGKKNQIKREEMKRNKRNQLYPAASKFSALRNAS